MLLMNPEKDGAIPAHMAPTPGPKMIRSQWIHLDKKKPGLIGRTGLSWTLMDQSGVDHILSIITWPKPEHDTWVAPSSRRAKS